MTDNVAYLITETGISLYLKGEQYVVSPDHANYSKILGAIKENRFDKIKDLVDVRTSAQNWISTDPDFTLMGDCIALYGVPFSDAVTEKVLSMMEAGHSPRPLYNFLRKVRNNPSFVAQTELLLFCVANKFMIDTEGNIIAYKSVNANYTDIHSGKFVNKVGAEHKMERFQVDDDRNNTCSRGFHFASYEYASTWAGSSDRLKLMVLQVDPADVVAIPADYNNQKGRTWRYKVIGELTNFERLVNRQVYDVNDLYGSDDDDDICEGCGYRFCECDAYCSWCGCSPCDCEW